MKAGGDSGRGFKVVPWLTLLGFLSSLLLYERVRGRARGSVHVGEFFVMRECVALGSPSQQGKFNKTYLTWAMWLVSQRETDEEGATDKEGKDQQSHFLYIRPHRVQSDLFLCCINGSYVNKKLQEMTTSLAWVWNNPADFSDEFF